MFSFMYLVGSGLISNFLIVFAFKLLHVKERTEFTCLHVVDQFSQEQLVMKTSLYLFSHYYRLLDCLPVDHSQNIQAYLTNLVAFDILFLSMIFISLS